MADYVVGLQRAHIVRPAVVTDRAVIAHYKVLTVAYQHRAVIAFGGIAYETLIDQFVVYIRATVMTVSPGRPTMRLIKVLSRLG